MIKIALGVVSLALVAGAYAANVANDTATNSPYEPSATWANGQNGGSGFSPWSIFVQANSGTFIGNSADNGGNGIGNPSWGMFASTGSTTTALRPFTSGGSNNSTILGPGQQFSILMDNGDVDTNSTVGFNLLNVSGTDRFTFQFVGGGNDYVYNLGNATNIDTGVGFTNNGLALVFTQGASNAFTLQITPIGGSTTTINGTLGVSDVDGVQLFNSNAGSGASNQLYFNNMSISAVPEPSTLSLSIVPAVLLGALLSCAAARKRKTQIAGEKNWGQI